MPNSYDPLISTLSGRAGADPEQVKRALQNGSADEKDATDWFKCTLIATKADGTTASVDIDLAKDGTYVSQWQLLDLSSLGKITSLGFAFTGSRSNDYGVLTPAYICLDDITVEY